MPGDKGVFGRRLNILLRLKKWDVKISGRISRPVSDRDLEAGNVRGYLLSCVWEYGLPDVRVLCSRGVL